ncbi:hypothetical protein N9V88_03500 [bacterium]|nr:hypothetical protein [bacterium]
MLKIGSRVTCLPIVHGSGDFAWEVRRLMLKHSFDCVAIPLPPSFQTPVEKAILNLPTPSVVFQKDMPEYQTQWTPESQPVGEEEKSPEPSSESDTQARDAGASYVPIDPCQGVIAAIRTAMGDHIPRKFIDLETSCYHPHTRSLPDAYALKKLPIERFTAAIVPHITASTDAQWKSRIACQAWKVRELCIDYKNILLVTSVLDFPWIRQAFHDKNLTPPQEENSLTPEAYQLPLDSLYFLLGELPFITGLYEHARQELSDDEHLSIDGLKELLIAAREDYQAEYKNRARKITPKILSQCLKYIRNLTLIDNRFTPQLTTIVTAAQQVAGDGYALHVLEKSKQFCFAKNLGLPTARLSIDRAELPGEEIVDVVSRLPGPPVSLSQIELIPRPDDNQIVDWQQSWDPYSQLRFGSAKEAMGVDLVQTEKFTTSIKDGIDIRDTVRHWYNGEIYVKVLPPSVGKLDCSVMLFDSPADPREYPWRTTWFAEHKNESTLAFFASDFADQPVGPGICLANYGGALFLYPPVAIHDIWQDPRLDFATTLEERLLAAACLHSRCPNIALVSPSPPGMAWRQLAKKFKKKLVHIPLSRFSDSTVQQLRMVHVLNGKDVRSYAADFIRKV